MSKNGILTMAMASLIGTGTAQACGLQGCVAASFAAPSGIVVAGDLASGLPAEFSVLIWAPLLLITIVCAGYLLWLIGVDAMAGQRKASSPGARVRIGPRIRRWQAGVHH